MGAEGCDMGCGTRSGGGSRGGVSGASDGGHLEVNGIEEAVGEGWRVGVCGWQRKAEQGVSDGKGGVQGTLYHAISSPSL